MANSVSFQRAIADAEATFNRLHPKSREIWQRSCEVLPGGNTRTVLYYDPFPLTFLSGQGARLTDADGITYHDLLNEFSAGIYGHSDPVIAKAMHDAIDSGIALGGLNVHESHLARLIADRFPSCEMVRFCNSATEANIFALAMARLYTDRSDIMVFEGGYHGGVLAFPTDGSPLTLPFPFRMGRYNDIEATLAAMRKDSDKLAAVIVEPMMGGGGALPATREFLQALRDAATELGVLLIFDEAMTSRMAGGGLQGFHGIRPDMTTMGKYLGGGLASGVFGGRREIMERLDPRHPAFIKHAGTFNNSIVAMAAGAAGMEKVFTPAAAQDLHDRGDRLRDKLNSLSAGSPVPFQATGIGSLVNMHFQEGEILHPDQVQFRGALRKLMHLELLNRGFNTARRSYLTLSLPVTDADIDAFVAAVGEVLDGFGALDLSTEPQDKARTLAALV